MGFFGGAARAAAITTFLDIPNCELLLDAGNSSSYSGSGTTWSDLSGNGRNATLVNSPTFDANDNGGSFAFNGSTQSAIVSGSITTSNCTIICWTRANGAQGNYDGLVFSRGSGSNISGIGIGDSNTKFTYTWNDDANTYNLATTPLMRNSEWIMCGVSLNTTEADIFVFRKDGLETRNHVYTKSSSTLNDIRIARDIFSAARYYDGKFAVVAIYSRKVSINDLNSLFSATKSKYGL